MLKNSATLFFGPWYRKTPFFEATRRYGCSAYDIYNHTYLPGYYDDPETEYWALVNDVTIWDVGCERIVEISGPDACEFINTLTCRDLTKCKVGQCKYMPVIAPDGGILNDPVMLRIEEDRWWLALADSDAGIFAMGVAANSGMDVTISHPPVYPIQVQGPKSKDTMRSLFGDEILDLKYYWCREAELDGIPVVISRTGWTAVVGYEIYLRDPTRGDDLWEKLIAAGKPHNIRPIAPSEARRLEAGIFNYGSDITLDNNPYEVMGLERLVEDQEADYLGKAALERIRREGVKRRLVGIEIEGPELRAELAEYWPVRAEGREIGFVTNAIWSPGLKRNIGYVWVPTAISEPGTQLEVQTPAGAVAGRTTAIPFVDPKKRTPLQ
ncbi:MAG: glycine cleavage system protein T [Myxococcales bacterium]|nr:glycine cleavage system protein T [Myxococcales bacterium]